MLGEEEAFLDLLGDGGEGEMLGVVVGGLGAAGQFLDHFFATYGRGFFGFNRLLYRVLYCFILLYIN